MGFLLRRDASVQQLRTDLDEPLPNCITSGEAEASLAALVDEQGG